MNGEQRVPDATVVIVSRNRRADLATALRSALAQRGAVEVLVIDDASDDGTAEMVAGAFPSARVVRFEQRAGLVVRRNDAARLARGPILISIDDDAAFSTPDIVEQTIADFDHPRVGAVAIPYFDLMRGSGELQRAPDREGRWVAATFRGTAHAIRRDLFLALGGYREEIVHQGEEPDFTLRMLDRGYLVRLGRADPIHHFESGRRDLVRMAVYGRRNELLLAFTHFAAPQALALAGAHALRGWRIGVRLKLVRATLRGYAAGVAICWQLRRERRPLAAGTIRLDRRLRRHGPLRLAEIEAQLPAMSPGAADDRAPAPPPAARSVG